MARDGMTWTMSLPLGVADPLFVAELALEMHMPVSELGERMSNYELTVFWPAYFERRRITQQAEAEKREGRRR
jgi:hypothetical protein